MQVAKLLAEALPEAHSWPRRRLKAACAMPATEEEHHGQLHVLVHVLQRQAAACPDRVRRCCLRRAPPRRPCHCTAGRRAPTPPLLILLTLIFMSTQVRKAMTKSMCMCMCMVRPVSHATPLKLTPHLVGSPLTGASLSQVEVFSINFLLACQARIQF